MHDVEALQMPVNGARDIERHLQSCLLTIVVMDEQQNVFHFGLRCFAIGLGKQRWSGHQE
jgi:hypothetical protein